MSGYLWKYYFEDDVDSFRHVLEFATRSARPGTQKSFNSWQGGSYGTAVNSSPGSYGVSPLLNSKGRKPPGAAVVQLTRSDINSRDGSGLTILHHAASSTSENALGFARTLLEHPLIDLYAQDLENSWTPLHRALYFGNVDIARLILNRDTQDILGHGSTGFNNHGRGLVKIKDREGYGPLDLFAMTIKDRTPRPVEGVSDNSDSDDEVAYGDSGDRDDEARRAAIQPRIFLGGDEVYTFGSNKNVTLGFGDEDDRQFPERIVLSRPDHLLQRLYREHRERQTQAQFSMSMAIQDSNMIQPKAVTDLPVHIRNMPLVIQDVQMSKLHTAILTSDSVSNLYMCGHGPGGRLGTGNETTKYQFTCIEAGGLGQKKIVAVALGQNHTLAVTDGGEIYSWGNNAFGQLGYSLPKPSMKDDDPISIIPRQIFGTLKRESVIGVAASRIHSVAHTSTSLYTFGKNEGQLGIVDSDARSLEAQVIPRKVAASLFSTPIASVSAIDGATICLLENREVWVFANYGYARLNFPLEGFTNSFFKESWLTTKYDTTPNKISKITSGGDTICALSSSGEVFTVSVTRRVESSQDVNTSTTNPKQIRGALSKPYGMWSAKSAHMAARDVDVDQDGSIILTTEAGSVWRRTKRATIKNTGMASTGEYRAKDYKFLRVPGLTRVVAVRASAFGAYAAIRKDCDVTRTQISVDEPRLLNDIAPLLSFNELSNYEETSDDEDQSLRFWQRPSNIQSLRKRTLKSNDLESEIFDILRKSSASSGHAYDMELGTTSSNVRIPVHEFIISGRSRPLRDALIDYRSHGDSVDIPDVVAIIKVGEKTSVLFQGLDFLTIFNLALYAYTDSVVDFWNVTHQSPKLAFRYHTARTELMKVASRLELHQLEQAVRQMVDPRKSLTADLESAVRQPAFFDSGDVIVELEDGEMLLHSDILCQRCPFFEGLYRGRAAGQWLAGRRADESSQTRIDLTHVDSQLFELVVRHIYTDAGEELFDNVTSEDLNDLFALEELLDHVMDVMSVANELMLDRLSQICQRIIGRYVNARNVCSLLNAIAPSSVVEFKNAALEYVCLSLEAVMQNGFLDELEDDLLAELNQVVRGNQLANLPFAKSGEAEVLLFEKYPELAERVEQGKRAKVDAIVLSNKFADANATTSSSFRAQSLEELSASPLRQRTRRRASREARMGAESPSVPPALKDKTSIPDLMFEMSDADDDDDDDDYDDLGGKIRTPLFTAKMTKKHVQTPFGCSEETSAEASDVRPLASMDSVNLQSQRLITSTPTQDNRPSGRPWGPAPLTATKLDLKDIMAQAATDRPSNLSLSLSQQVIDEKPSGSFHAKMSQKQRKKLQAQLLGRPTTIEKTQPAPPAMSPWQAMSHRKITQNNIAPVASPPSASSLPSPPQLTMRQTIANSKTISKQKNQQTPQQVLRSASSGTRASQGRPSSSERGMAVSTTPIPTPHSVRHIPLPFHSPTSPSQNLSMSEILSLQQAEKVCVRDAATKRSLQDIQQEQEFQEWWDQESKRVIFEEEQRKRAEERVARADRGTGKNRSNKGKGKAKDKMDGEENVERGKGNRDVNPAVTSHETMTPKSAQKQGNSDRGRGRGRGYRGGHGGRRGGRA